MDVLSTVYGPQVLAEDAKTGDVVSSRREQLERGQGLNGEQAWLGMSVASVLVAGDGGRGLRNSDCSIPVWDDDHHDLTCSI